MYKKTFQPTEYDQTIEVQIPPAWRGQVIEITVRQIVDAPEVPDITDEEFYALCGQWESDKTADEMIAEIRAARNFREKDLNWA
jgi:hypothetical protein